MLVTELQSWVLTFSGFYFDQKVLNWISISSKLGVRSRDRLFWFLSVARQIEGLIQKSDSRWIAMQLCLFGIKSLIWNIQLFFARYILGNCNAIFLYTKNEIQWIRLLAHSINLLRPSDVYICVSKLNIIGSDNGLSPGRRQAIIWTNAGILLIGPLGTNFSEIEINIFSFKKCIWKCRMENGGHFAAILSKPRRIVAQPISLSCLCMASMNTHNINSRHWLQK